MAPLLYPNAESGHSEEEISAAERLVDLSAAKPNTTVPRAQIAKSKPSPRVIYGTCSRVSSSIPSHMVPSPQGLQAAETIWELRTGSQDTNGHLATEAPDTTNAVSSSIGPNRSYLVNDNDDVNLKSTTTQRPVQMPARRKKRTLLPPPLPTPAVESEPGYSISPPRPKRNCPPTPKANPEPKDTGIRKQVQGIGAEIGDRLDEEILKAENLWRPKKLEDALRPRTRRSRKKVPASAEREEEEEEDDDDADGTEELDDLSPEGRERPAPSTGAKRKRPARRAKAQRQPASVRAPPRMTSGGVVLAENSIAAAVAAEQEREAREEGGEEEGRPSKRRRRVSKKEG